MTNAMMPAYPNPYLKVRTLDDEIRSLTFRYGADEVRAATKRATAKKPGRKAEKDWLHLRAYIEQDARDWLDGKDPFAERSNYSIATAVSEKNTGYSKPATHRRLMRKLANMRREMALYGAMLMAEKDRPYGDLFRVLNALAELEDSTALRWIDLRNGQLQRYRQTIGEPDRSLTFAAIEEELAKPRAFPAPNALLGGLFGTPKP